MTIRVAEAVRRTVDVAAAAAGLVVLAPVLIGVAVTVRVSMGSGVLFRQPRLGRGGQPFTLLKFRTMRHATAGRDGPEFDAERLGTVGQWLRATSLDELPSLANLFLGEITLVGPRPLPVHYWPRFRGDEYRRFEVRPGITGLAQINGRNTSDWDERLGLDIDYIRTRTLLGDMRILLATVPVVLRREGISHATGATMHALPPDRPE